MNNFDAARLGEAGMLAFLVREEYINPREAEDAASTYGLPGVNPDHFLDIYELHLSARKAEDDPDVIQPGEGVTAAEHVESCERQISHLIREIAGVE